MTLSIKSRFFFLKCELSTGLWLSLLWASDLHIHSHIAQCCWISQSPHTQLGIVSFTSSSRLLLSWDWQCNHAAARSTDAGVGLETPCPRALFPHTAPLSNAAHIRPSPCLPWHTLFRLYRGYCFSDFTDSSPRGSWHLFSFLMPVWLSCLAVENTPVTS